MKPLHDFNSNGTEGVNLRGIATLMKQAALLGEQVTGARDMDFESQIVPVALGLFRLVVMGEIKKGKSSFVNALLGCPGLVPVASEIATSSIYKIRFGPTLRYTVFFKPSAAGVTPEPLVIEPSQLEAYGTEIGNPGNQKAVDFIGVEAPSPLLRDGLVIVDTPGVGGLFKEHRDITFRYAPKSDGIFFVTDNDAPIGAEEVKFLQELRSVTSMIYFVQTKGDRMEAEDRRRLMQGNIEILTNQAGFARQAIRYFVVSATLKENGDAARNLEDFHDSGFSSVVNFLNNELKPRKNVAVALQALQRTGARIGVMDAELTTRAQIADASTDESRKALENELREAAQAVARWNAEDRPALVSEYREELGLLRGKLNLHLNRAIRPMGPIAQQAQAKLETFGSAERIYKEAKTIGDDVRAEVARHLLRELGDIEKGMSDLVEALTVKAGAQLAIRLLPASDTQVVNLGEAASAPLGKRGDGLFGKARATLAGGSAGMTIASIGTLAVMSLTAAPAVIAALPVAFVLTVVWGAWSGFSIQHRQEKQRALAEVMGIINQELGDAQMVAQNEFMKAFQKLEAEGTAALGKAVETASAGIVEKERLLAQRCHESKEVLRQNAATLQRQRGELEQIRQQVANIQKQLAP